MNYRSIYGYSLLEILISLFLLSFILLGFNAVLLTSVYHAQNAYYYTVASQQMTSMIEQLYVYGADANLRDYIDRWSQDNATLLPYGIGEVSGEFPEFYLLLRWGKNSNCHSHPVNCLKADVYV